MSVSNVQKLAGKTKSSWELSARTVWKLKLFSADRLRIARWISQGRILLLQSIRSGHLCMVISLLIKFYTRTSSVAIRNLNLFVPQVSRRDSQVGGGRQSLHGTRKIFPQLSACPTRPEYYKHCRWWYPWSGNPADSNAKAWEILLSGCSHSNVFELAAQRHPTSGGVGHGRILLLGHRRPGSMLSLQRRTAIVAEGRRSVVRTCQMVPQVSVCSGECSETIPADSNKSKRSFFSLPKEVNTFKVCRIKRNQV